MTRLECMPRLQRRRTKIVATVGPACAREDVLRRLWAFGVDVFRLNMSHGDHALHRKNWRMICEQAARVGRRPSLLVDLCGPKIRCGRFRDGEIVLREGEEVWVTCEPDTLGEAGLIPSQYAGLARDVRAGERILLDDGLLCLRVLAVEENRRVLCRVEHGGRLRDHKGINLPDSVLSTDALTEKDRRDAVFAMEMEADFIAISFVRSADDVRQLRSFLATDDLAIIAKIERPEAVEQADAIIEQADGIMVARGDLGVEIPAEQVPLVQRMLIDHARRHDKPVIVATQMLESMIEHPCATRAEVTDVFHSVHDATDAVMLSGETAIGRHPVEAVETMDRVIRHAEACLWRKSGFGSLSLSRQDARASLAFNDALAEAMAMLSRRLMVRAVVVFSPTGVTARAMAAARPEAPMLAVSPSSRICRRLNLLWGVIAVRMSEEEMRDDPCALAARLARRFALAEEGQTILLVRGFHKDPARNHPTVTIVRVHGGG